MSRATQEYNTCRQIVLHSCLCAQIHKYILYLQQNKRNHSFLYLLFIYKTSLKSLSHTRFVPSSKLMYLLFPILSDVFHTPHSPQQRNPTTQKCTKKRAQKKKETLLLFSKHAHTPLPTHHAVMVHFFFTFTAIV